MFDNSLKRTFKKMLAVTKIRDPFRKMFTEVEFETTAYCNKKCVYCPNSSYERIGDVEQKYMKESTFENILKGLVDLKFKGMIAPHLYGEPLTDPRLINWVKKIHQHLPESTIKIVTNADFLNQELYHSFMNAGVSFFHISKHGAQLPKQVVTLLNSLPEDEKKRNLRLFDFYADYFDKQEMLNTRGGEVSLKEKKLPPICCSYVIYPVINTFGDVILCCNDFHSKYVAGNINQKSLGEVWFSPKNLKFRREIYKGHFNNDLCKNCFM